MSTDIYTKVKLQTKAKDIKELRSRIEKRRNKEDKEIKYKIHKEGAVITAG